MDPSSIRLGLDAVRAVCRALDDPQLAVPSVLIAGTNGKGSTASMLVAIARAAGLRVGLFHSPALGGEHEQIHIGGQALTPAFYEELMLEVEGVAERIDQPLTAFERTTVAAFLAFARSELDLAIIEVGLGGARDATNVAEPVMSALTTVDLDHQAWLGSSLAAIAREKAGVFRQRRPAVLGFLRGPALRAARQEAEKIGARVISARSSVQSLKRAAEPTGDGPLWVQTERSSYRLDLRLVGEHQERNAALAVIAAESLMSRWPVIDRSAIESGLSAAEIPGRLEWLDRDGCQFLLDAAHNPAAVAALVDYLQTLPERPDLLFGAFADKDFRTMLETLRPAVGRLLLTPIKHSRSWQPEKLAGAFGGELVRSVQDGLANVRSLQGRQIPLLITGSMRLVGDARRLLLEPATSHAAGG